MKTSAPPPFAANKGVLLLLLLLSLLSIDRSAVAGPLDNCPVDCGPNGHCFDGGCECDPGFAGADCSFPYEICPDAVRQCFGTGSRCVKDSNNARGDNGNGFSLGLVSEYSCSCDDDASDVSDPFEIRQCETPESQHCEEGRSTPSEYAFCTNGGTCLAMVRHGERHAGCHCPTDFEGRHCQYRKGTAPAYELSQQSPSQKGGGSSTGALDGFVKFVIALVCLSLIAGFGHIVYHNYKAKRQAALEGDDFVNGGDGKNRDGIEPALTMDSSGDEMDEVLFSTDEEENEDNSNDRKKNACVVDGGEMA